MFRFAAASLLALSAVSIPAHADVYSVNFTGYQIDDPNGSLPGVDLLDFTFNTDKISNNAFDPETAFSCGTGKYDCFANVDSDIDDGNDVIVFRDGEIRTGGPESFDAPDIYVNAVPLFTGPDSAPTSVRTGTFDSGYEQGFTPTQAP